MQLTHFLIHGLYGVLYGSRLESVYQTSGARQKSGLKEINKNKIQKAMITWHTLAWSATEAAANICGPCPPWFPVQDSHHQVSPQGLISPGYHLLAHCFLTVKKDILLHVSPSKWQHDLYSGLQYTNHSGSRRKVTHRPPGPTGVNSNPDSALILLCDPEQVT